MEKFGKKFNFVNVMVKGEGSGFSRIRSSKLSFCAF